jgi:lipopolysaccharide heptosyltransferase II
MSVCHAKEESVERSLRLSTLLHDQQMWHLTNTMSGRSNSGLDRCVSVLPVLSYIPMKIPREEIHRILCIKPRGIGDIVLSTIILENLAAAFPSAVIDYLTEHFAMDAVRNTPLVNDVVGMENDEFVLRTAWRVRKRQYDLVIDLWSNPRSAQITLLSGARYRVGYAYRGRKYAYNILGPDDRGDHHSAEHNLELLRALDIPVVSRRIHFSTLPEDDTAARQWLSAQFGRRPVIGIVPSGGWPSKRCTPATWIAICRGLIQRYHPAFLVLWGPGDEDDAAAIGKGVGQAITLAPPTSVRLMAAFLKMCTLVIANDSGPMHIAAALDVPTIGIFGPTDPGKHGPLGPHSGFVINTDLHCSICNKLECPYGHECMTELPIQELLAKVEALAGSRLRINLSNA